MGALRARIRALFQILLHEHTAPGRVAAAVVLGCAVGCTPLFGLHFPLCVLLALLFRLNKLVVYGAANLSIPPMVPILGFLSVQIGEYLLRGRPPGLHLADFRSQGALELGRRFFSAWMVGGLVLGSGIGLVAGAIAYGALRARRRRAAGEGAAGEGAAGEGAAGSETPAPIREAIERARGRFLSSRLRPFLRHYAGMKYRMDPCYRAIAALIPEGAYLVDLGTGLGMLPICLGELGGGRRALGVEWDEEKVEGGQAVCAGLPVELVRGDIFAFALPPCDAVSLVDVLHYYDGERQRALLERAAAALRPGGQLLVREGDGELRGGARLTRLLERWAVRLGWNRAPRVRFRPIAELEADLSALGLEVERAEVAGALHPGNVLLRALRPEGGPREPGAS